MSSVSKKIDRRLACFCGGRLGIGQCSLTGNKFGEVPVDFQHEFTVCSIDEMLTGKDRYLSAVFGGLNQAAFPMAIATNRIDDLRLRPWR